MGPNMSDLPFGNRGLSARESGPPTPRALLRALTNAQEHGRACAVATVISTSRSVPRRAGAKMLIHPDGSTFGSVGGGEMEARVVRVALECMRTGRPERLSYDLVDAGSGDPGVCGGTVELYVEPIMPTPTVYVIGCGHVGRAVVDLAHWLGYRVVATDDRPELVTAEALPHADVILSAPISDVLAQEPVTPQDSIVLVTRNVAVDLAILPDLLRTPARYIGVMGSRRRWDTTRQQLIAAGVATADADRVRTPIGIEINAETPEEIALSIMAEVVAAARTTA